MKKTLVILVLVAIFITPSLADAASLIVTSPVNDAVYLFGQKIPLTWIPISPGVSTIEIIDVKTGDGVLQIYGQKVFDDPTNRNGFFDYTLASYRVVPSGQYKIKLTPLYSTKYVYSPAFFIKATADEDITVLKDSTYTFGKVLGFKTRYMVNEAIHASIIGHEAKNDTAESDEGFNVQAFINDPKYREKGAIQGVNGTFNVETKMWDISMAGLKKGSYELEFVLYCSDRSITSYCGKTYTNGQTVKRMKFKVR